MPAMAAPVEHDGLEFEMITDKEIYEPGEEINAVIRVKNTGAETVIIADLEQLVPEGYKIKEEAEFSFDNLELAPGEELTLNVTFESTAEPSMEEKTENFFDTIIYGESFGIPNLLITIIVIIAIIVFFKLT